MDWAKLWQDIVNFFSANVWNIIFFFVTLFVGLIIIKIFIFAFRKILNRTKMEKIAQNFLVTIIKFCLYLALLLILLSQIGIQISGILTAISALLLAIGMALQSNVANLANGIIIVSNHMFKKGDYIIVKQEDVEGNIVEINFLFTTLMTVDNKKITLPNSAIVNGSVVNLGANQKRRVDFTFSVAYESDVEKVKKIVLDVMKSNGKVYLDPEPFCKLKTLGSSSIDFFANCWVDSTDYWDVYYYVTEWVYNEFKRNKISIPFSQIEVRERKDKPKNIYNRKNLPKRVEKEREEKNTKKITEILVPKKKKGKIKETELNTRAKEIVNLQKTEKK